MATKHLTGILLEMTSSEFTKKFLKFAKSAKVKTMLKVIDSIEDDPPGIKDRLSQAYEDWIEKSRLDQSSLGTYIIPVVKDMSPEQVDQLFSAMESSPSVPIRMSSSVHADLFQEIVKRLKKSLSPADADLARSEFGKNFFTTSSHSASIEAAYTFFTYVLSAIREGGTSLQSP